MSQVREQDRPAKAGKGRKLPGQKAISDKHRLGSQWQIPQFSCN
jgi:hypothetical protein